MTVIKEKEKKMKILSPNEFKRRALAVSHARKIFIPHVTKNITIAFEMYLQVMYDMIEPMRLRLTSRDGGRPPTLLDTYVRPKCPKCGWDLFLRLISSGGKCPQTGKVIPENANRFGWRSCWECVKGDCVYEEYSKKELKDWLMTLPKKEEEGG